jgi:hypothetical protein
MRDRPDVVQMVELARQYHEGDPRRGIQAGRYKEVWVVFDWDDHTDRVREAQKLATRYGVKMALSNPSFEAWLIWHFDDYYSIGCFPDDCLRRITKHLPSYCKGKDFDFTVLLGEGRTRQACDRADSARDKHRREGRCFPDDRPSSDLDHLIKVLVDAWQIGNPGEICPLMS